MRDKYIVQSLRIYFYQKEQQLKIITAPEIEKISFLSQKKRKNLKSSGLYKI